jgi:hypothetical protein
MVNRRVGNLRKEGGGSRRGGFTGYKPPSVDFVKRQSERQGGRFDRIVKDGFDVFRPKVGDNQIRVLPATWDDHDDYAFIVWVHRRVGPDNSTYLCPRKMLNKKCPICEESQAARKAGEADEAKALDVGEQMLCWVIDRDDESKSPKPQIYQMSAPFYKDVNALCYDNRTGSAMFIDNPDEGHDLRIKRTGAGLKTRYLPSISPNKSAVAKREEVQEEILDFIAENPVPSVLKYYSYDYLAKIIAGTNESKDEDIDEDEDEKRPAKRKPRDEDAPEDDDSDEAPFDKDEDDAEERPRARKRDRDEDDDRPRHGKRKPAADDDDDAEEERPRKRKPARDDDEQDHDREREEEEENEGREARASMRRKPREEQPADEDEDRPRKRKPRDDDDAEEDRPRARKKPREEPDEEEQEDDPPPRKRSRRPADEEDEAPEDEPEERPRRRARG